MRTRTKFIGAVAASAACILISTQTPASAASDVRFTDGVVSRIQGSGSDTIYFIMNDLAQAYMESEGCLLNNVDFPVTQASPTQNRCRSGAGVSLAGENIYENYDHDVIVNFFPQGSNAGRRQLCLQREANTTENPSTGTKRSSKVPAVQFARSSSAPTVGFQCARSTNVGPGDANSATNDSTIDVNDLGDAFFGEGGTVLRFVAYALDGISYTHWDTPTGGGGAVTNLTQGELNDIFVDCTITDWGQVPGGVAGKPIVVFTSIPGSGTRSSWDSFVGGSSDVCIPNTDVNPVDGTADLKDGSFANGERVLREHQMEGVETALNDPAATDEGNSIYYMGAGLHTACVSCAQNSLLGDVNGIAATPTNIANGTFPFTRSMYNVFRNGGPNAPVAPTAVRRFLGMGNFGDPQQVGWICKGDAYHSKPVSGLGSGGPGIATAAASLNYAELKAQVFADNGFVQLPPQGVAGHRCTFTDVTVAGAAPGATPVGWPPSNY